jgi:ATP-dependent Lhr-like helicase
MKEVIEELGMQWQVGIRNGDTEINERQRQKRQMPEVLIITPESLHLLLAQKNYPDIFKSLRILAVDEWHELLGSKRGVQVELAVSRIANILDTDAPYHFSLWGISATIGNLEQAQEVLLSPILKKINHPPVKKKKKIDKRIEIESVIPDEIEKYPWAGHLGIKLVHKVISIIEKSRTTLIFINTRGMSERWYRKY